MTILKKMRQTEKKGLIQSYYELAVGAWGMAPSEFWRMSPGGVVVVLRGQDSARDEKSQKSTGAG